MKAITMLVTASLGASLGLALLTADAAADAREDVDLAMHQYASQLEPLQRQLNQGLRKDYTIAGCREAIVSARAAGVPASYAMKSYAFDKVKGARRVDGDLVIELANAGLVCDQFASAYRLAQAAAVLAEGLGGLDWLAVIDLSTNHAENGAALAKMAKACDDGLATLVGEGVATNVELEIYGRSSSRKVTVAAGRTQICGKLAEVARTFAKDVTDARQAEYDRYAAPFKAIGVTGDRLEFLVNHAGYAKYGAGGRELTAPKALAKAAVIFEVLTGQGEVTVRRYQFTGDALVGTTQQHYDRRPGAAAFR